MTPATTHILIRHIDDDRRTDGRDWPDDLDPTFLGYSIDHWIDTDGDGRYDVPPSSTPTMNSFWLQISVRQKPGEDQRQIMKDKRTGSREDADEVNP